MYGTGSNPLFTDSLLEAGDSILSNILELPVISSLAGSEQLSREKLIEARNNFYVQDYFYLVYGYKVVGIFLLDTLDTIDPWLLEQINTINPMLLEDCNPLLSISVTNLLDGIDKINTRNLLNQIDTDLSIAGSRPNQATQRYIIFKIWTAFQDDIQTFINTLVVRFACLWIYYEIGVHLNDNRNQYHEDPEFKREFKNWFDLLIDPDNKKYFDKYKKLIDNLREHMNLTDSRKIEELQELFLEACRLEYGLFNSLLS